MICVKCGKNNASEGSLRYPCCKKCFKDVWDNDYDQFYKWLQETHK